MAPAPEALPVAVEGPGPVAAQVGAWVEAHLGWQVTDGGDLPAVVRLAALGRGAVPADDLPTVGLVLADDDPVAVARAAGRVGAVAAWPDDHATLADLVADVLGGGTAGISAAAPDAPGDDDRFVVGAACGGVGATTVALALGGWHVWRRQDARCLVVASGPVPVPGATPVHPTVLAGHRAWAAGVEVAGVPGLHVAPADRPPDRLAPPAGAGLVWDVGVVAPDDPRLDVLVVRRDRCGAEAAAASTCAAVVVVDTGPVTAAAMTTAVAGRRVVTLPWSVRVARAHARQRVPDGLPGRWLGLLRPLLG